MNEVPRGVDNGALSADLCSRRTLHRHRTLSSAPPPIPMPSPLSPLHALRALVALGSVLALGACDVPAAQSSAASVTINPLRAEPATPAMTGRFRVVYGEVEDSTYARWQDDFREARFLEGVAEWLNEWIALPQDVTLGFEACGEPNAYYHPEQRAVSLCYELVEDLDDALGGEGTRRAPRR